MSQLPRDPGPQPKSSTSTLTRTLIVAVASVLDACKFAAFCLVLFAPLLIGVGAKLITQSYLEQQLGHGLGSFVASGVGVAAGTAAAALELTQPEVDAAIEGLGLILAWIIALTGVILLMLLLGIFVRGELLEPRIFLGVIAMCTTSLIPFIDGTPTLTVGTWNILRQIKRHDAERMSSWRQAKQAFDTARAAQRRAQQEAAEALVAPPEAEIEEAPAFVTEEPSRKSPQLVAVPAYGV